MAVVCSVRNRLLLRLHQQVAGSVLARQQRQRRLHQVEGFLVIQRHKPKVVDYLEIRQLRQVRQVVGYLEIQAHRVDFLATQQQNQREQLVGFLVIALLQVVVCLVIRQLQVKPIIR